MAEAIGKGDVVVLKSGGPAMTVSKVEGGRAICDWFVDNVRHVQSFDLAVLEKFEPVIEPEKARLGIQPERER